jgi:RNA ligase (TIGR02306 family)
MSEFHIVVVKLGKIDKLENSDNLAITMVMEGYPCIVKLGEYKEGDLAVYCPIDSLVPLESPYFSFLSENIEKKYFRVKAIKKRGTFSMGLLVPADPLWKEGKDVQELLGIKKWEPVEIFSGPSLRGEIIGKGPSNGCEYTDIEGMRKYEKLLIEGEKVVCTEKVHGSSARFLLDDTDFWVGSHTTWKKENDTNLWWKVAHQYNIREKLKYFLGFEFFGEVYGQVQKGFTYGAAPRELFLAFFDILDTKRRVYLDYDAFLNITKELDLPVVPQLYRGPWSSELKKLTDGITEYSKIRKTDTIREGIVVKPVIERRSEIGRTILKLHSQEYFIKTGKIK